MGLLGMTDNNIHILLFVMSLLGLILGIWALLISYAGFAPVWETRPEVINFPGWATVHAAPDNPNVMPRQFTQAQKRFLHERRGPVYNFGAQWGPPGDQGWPRPEPNEGRWWGNEPN